MLNREKSVFFFVSTLFPFLFSFRKDRLGQQGSPEHAAHLVRRDEGGLTGCDPEIGQLPGAGLPRD